MRTIAFILCLMIISCTQPGTLKQYRFTRIKYKINYTEYSAFAGGLIRPNGDTVWNKNPKQ